MSKTDKLFWGTLLALGIIIALATQGCGTFTVKPGADPVVVYAEAAYESGLELFDSFLAWERRNEATLLKIDPQIHKLADDVRDHGAQWLTELLKAKRAYQVNKTEGNKITLAQAVEVMQMAIDEVRLRMAQGKL